MKLPIKKKYFDMIKNGEKIVDYRDAHITFVCEETGETIRKSLIDAVLFPKKDLKELPGGKRILEENPEMFEDDVLVAFLLSRTS